MKVGAKGIALVLCSLSLAFSACGGDPGAAGSSCTVTSNADMSSTISCTDGTTVTVPPGSDGTDGTDGTPGTPGTPGTTCTVVDNLDGTKTISCSDGTTVTVNDGDTGVIGDPGRNAWVVGEGLKVTITGVTIPADGQPVVSVTITDAADRPLDRAGMYTTGAVSVNWLIGYLPSDATTGVGQYVNYITRSVTVGTVTATQPVSEPSTGTGSGTWTEVDPTAGTYTYRFALVLPAGFDVTKTHTVGAYATRTFEDVRYVANPLFDFRPDAMAVTETRDIAETATCNSCHTTLAFHGGSRREVGLCVMCHTAGMSDPDTQNSINMPNMVHRIHRGAGLPSVRAGTPYEIIGYRGTVYDYSTVVFPQDIRNCATCHTGADGDRWNTAPDQSACASCHDDIYFGAAPVPLPPGMRLHSGGMRADGTCSGCHDAATVTSDHFTKFQRPTAQNVVVTINSATMTAARLLLLDFTVTVNGTGRNILTSPLTSFSAVVAGPTTDYLFNASFTLSTTATTGTLAAAADAVAGHFTWTSATTVDAIAATALATTLRTTPGIAASGTWAIGMQAYLRDNDPATTTACVGTSTTACTAAAAAPMGGSWACVSGFCTPGFLYAATNPVAYVAITDPVAVPRREVVDMAKCNGCHEQLAFHGGGRNAPEYCVMCHNATFDTADRMPIPTGTTARTLSVSAANFFHRIHTGEDGVSPATFWTPRPATPINSGGSLVDFAEVRFPADRRACDSCHVSMSTATDLDAMSGLLAPRERLLDDTRTIVETYTQGAISSACTGCHDGPSAVAHTEIMTTAMGVESCASCHDAGSEFSVEASHARPGL